MTTTMPAAPASTVVAPVAPPAAQPAPVLPTPGQHIAGEAFNGVVPGFVDEPQSALRLCALQHARPSPAPVPAPITPRPRVRH